MRSVGDLGEYTLEKSCENIQFKASMSTPFSSFKGETWGFMGKLIYIVHSLYKFTYFSSDIKSFILQNDVLVVVEY
jgi:hypothetical protein